MAWKRYNISMESDIWEGSQRIIKGQLNMSMSKYIEIMLRQVIASQTQTQRQMYENLAGLLATERMAKPGQNVTEKVTKSKQRVNKKVVK